MLQSYQKVNTIQSPSIKDREGKGMLETQLQMYTSVKSFPKKNVLVFTKTVKDSKTMQKNGSRKLITKIFLHQLVMTP